MVTLRTLGECVIEVGDHRLGPSASHVFGALLYLGIERGRCIPRATLQALLYPEATEAKGAHSLRQLIYKLRTYGVPVDTGTEGVRLAADQVRDDYSPFFVIATDERADVDRAGGGFLPGYAPKWSKTFADWVEDHRGHVQGRIRRILLAELSEHRRVGRWDAAERTARACLATDPLNEEATLGLAEVMAVAGSKVQAMRLLDHYIAESGQSGEGLRLPASVLRRRIAERLPAIEYDASRAPFVGRHAEMAELNALLALARRGESRTAIVWGEAGIGKTRLVAEFCKGAVLGGATVLRSVSQPHDVRRPMGTFLDLTPRLLKLPGALGTSPEAMKYLQRLVTFDPQVDQPITAEMRDPEYLAACITRALSELLDAVSAESPLILVIEDAQWLDRVSSMVLGDLLSERRERRLLLVCTWRAHEIPAPETPRPDRTSSLRIRGLHPLEAARLLGNQWSDLSVPAHTEIVEWGVRTAQGNPFFLHEIARHYAVHRDIGSAPSSLIAMLDSRLHNVSSTARRLLASIAMLGQYSNQRRLESISGIARQEYCDALQQLEQQSLVECVQEVVQVCHPLIGEHALAGLTKGVKSALHRHVAEVLARDVAIGDPGLVLLCAFHWARAGAADQSVSVLRQCGANSARLGYCREALHFTSQALQSCSDDERRASIALELLELAEVSDDPATIALVADTTLATLRIDRVPKSLREALTLNLLRSQWRAGKPSDFVREGLQQLVESDNVDIRLAALRQTFVLCDWESNAGEAAALYLKATNFLDSLSADLRERSHVDLVYHAAFGDITVARRIAMTSWKRIRGHLREPGCLIEASNVGVAFGRCDDWQNAYEVLGEAVAIASDLGLSGHVSFNAAQAAATYLDAGDPESAFRYHKIAEAAFRVRPPTHAYSTHLMNEMRLGLFARDYEAVASAFRDIQQIFAAARTPKLLMMATLLAMVAELDRRGCVTHSELTELRSQTGSMIGDDSFDAAIVASCHVLRSVGEIDEATELETRHRATRRNKGVPYVSVMQVQDAD